MTRLIVGVFVGFLGGLAASPFGALTQPASTPAAPAATHAPGDHPMQLGNFSVSLAVKDIAASRAFYEKMGFRVRGGDQAKNWLILQNETSTIGIFQGMFKGNILTFNPGWDRACNTLAEFDDVREIQRTLKKQGLALTTEADESTTGPASLMLQDPDGNTILIDQHVPAPGKK
ncbi:MAG: VOC family protein [Phycisphaeraceae bacterium]|nr:VOC family protein [Phycisphaeraceae bacterium]